MARPLRIEGEVKLGCHVLWRGMEGHVEGWAKPPDGPPTVLFVSFFGGKGCRRYGRCEVTTGVVRVLADD